MQGITKRRHGHMIDALRQLEKILACEQPECGCLQQANDHRKELETMYDNYEKLLEKLAEQISAYEALFGHVKVHVLSKKPKELKKEISTDRTTSIPALALLHNNIQLAYGT